MPLTAAQLDTFRRDGFLVIEKFVVGRACGRLRRRAQELVDAFEPQEAVSIFSTTDQEHLTDQYFLESGGKIRFFFEEDAFDPSGTLRQEKALSINKIGHAMHDLDPEFGRFSRTPAIAGLVAQLGFAEPLALQSMYIFKQPRIGGAVAYHQDSTYLYTEPASVIGLWFALEDATTENGCLWALPGGHAGGIRTRFRRKESGGVELVTFDASPWPVDQFLPLEVPKGTLVVLHGALPHGSAPNRSEMSRHAYTLHVIDGACHYPADNWLQRGPGMPLRGLEEAAPHGQNLILRLVSRAPGPYSLAKETYREEIVIMKHLFIAAVAALGLTFTAQASAQDFTPAIVFDMGGKFDKSFNEAAFNGAEQFKNESGIAYREFEITSPAQREQALRNMARRGANVVVAMGFAQATAVEKIAKEFPDVKFTIIDAVVDLPNVQSVVFKEHEGSFLVGMAAAMASKTGKVGFVGGMDIPLIRNFAAGYVEGAKFVNPDITVYQNMTGTTPAAWNNPGKGNELARSQFDRGADVVYAAAGGTGIGVYQAAKDSGKLAIGVDSNQNYLHPGTMLTSMIKRVDVAVFNAFATAKDGTWKGGVQVLGLAEEGVGYSIDEHNRSLISADMEKRLEAARADIISGKITVDGYTN